MQLKKSLVALSLTAGLVGGGAAGAVLGAPGLSGAQEDTTTTVAEDPGASTDRSADREARMRERLSEVLAPLVEDGTIDQSQADAVVSRLVDAAPDRGPGHGGPGRGHRGMGLRTAADALGMTPSELAAELRDGSTLAQVAQERGVAVQTVIDALVAEVKEHLDERVADGDLTQAEADERLAEATERITERVNEGRPEGGPGGRGGRGGRGGPGGPGGPEGSDPEPGD